MNSIRIKYLFHSGYVVEFPDKILIFDYYKGALSNFLRKDKKIYFFVSHGHKDHFNNKIFGYKDIGKTYFILSNDILGVKKEGKILNIGQNKEEIENKKRILGKNVHLMASNQTFKIDDMLIKTFGSTDLGVSFLVQTQGVGIFHAGDLNLWIWDEDTKEEREEMYKAFMKEIKKISLEKIDIAFFPLDPRLEERAEDGLKIFIDEVPSQLVFPMHQEDDYSKSISFFNNHSEYRNVFKPIYDRGQTFIISLE